MLSRKSLLQILLLAGTLLVSNLAHATDYTVGCPGGVGGTYPSINAILPLLVVGDAVFVSGTCTEDVTLHLLKNVSLISTTSANLAGSLAIIHSSDITVYGMNITSLNNNGIYVEGSRDVVIDSCSSNGNAGAGLLVDNTPDVFIYSYGSFNNNGNTGMSIGSNSTVSLFGFSGVIDISDNSQAGIYASGPNAGFSTLGNLNIAGNKIRASNDGAVSGFGVDLRGGARAQFGAYFGPNTIQQNQAGGVSLQENAEISFWGGNLIGGQLNIIQNNGPVGVVVAFGSQATFFDSARILGHSDVGVDVYANSQAYFNADNKIQGNGTGLSSSRAGLRVDGNSEAFLRGGEFWQNGGPGILALVNSSLDFAGLVFNQNFGGNVVCDSSTYMVSDLSKSQANPASGFVCQTPHNYGNHHNYKMGTPHVPDWSIQKARHDYYQKLIAKH